MFRNNAFSIEIYIYKCRWRKKFKLLNYNARKVFTNENHVIFKLSFHNVILSSPLADNIPMLELYLHKILMCSHLAGLPEIKASKFFKVFL